MASLEELSKQFEGFQDMMQKSLDKLSGLEAWKTAVDESMGTILTKSDENAARLLRLEHIAPTAPPQLPRSPPGWVGSSSAVATQAAAIHVSERPSAQPTDQPVGHGYAPCNRDDGGGILGPPPRPVNGTPIDSNFLGSDMMPMEHERAPRSASLPKMKFPQFDGSNPRLWSDQCEIYFEVYSVSPLLKTRFAALNFSGPAAIWLQTMERRQRFQHWDIMKKAVIDHFDRDQYKIQLRQLQLLRQTASVAEYQCKFEELSHSILLYNPSYDDTFFVTQFLGGLKEEIRAAIALHRPKTVVEASELATLQELELETLKQKTFSRSEFKAYSKFQNKASMVDASKGHFRKEDQKQGLKQTSAQSDDKLKSLKAFRRENGLCFVCGEKWTGKNHQCPSHIPIHVLQELIDAVQADMDPDYDSAEDDTEESAGQIIMAVQQKTLDIGKRRNRTLRFRGFIGKKEVLILLDSGSAGTFISKSLADQLAVKLQPCDTVAFLAAGGQTLESKQMIPKLQWHIQNSTFQFDVRILPLSCYDMILGADWLEIHSPMWFHWRNKLVKFNHLGRRITLQGIQDEQPTCIPVSHHKLKGLLKHQSVSHVLQLQELTDSEPSSDSVMPDSTPQAAVQALLHEFEGLFQEPSGLPPSRSYDHQIPLIPGAQPVNVRPYRYAPQ